MGGFGDLIYTSEKAKGEAASKIESHTPRIEVPEKVRADKPFRVRIKIGPHPNTAEHSIRWIKVFFEEEGRSFNPVHIATISLEPIYSEPEIEITLKLRKPGILYVLGYCNLHGVWEAHERIEVEEA